jgi:hypothetical protein
MSAADHDTDFPSIFAQKFNISNFKTNPFRWNKEWDKVLQTLSATDVFDTFNTLFKRAGNLDMDKLQDRAIKCQELVVQVWGDLEEKGHFVTAWLLLEEEERLMHLMKGLEESFKYSLCAQDSRALCPEISTSGMQKEKGQAFIDFIRGYSAAKKDVGENNMYRLPSEWWEKVVDASRMPLEGIKITIELLTIQRNEFIGRPINAFHPLPFES